MTGEEHCADYGLSGVSLTASVRAASTPSARRGTA
jgi:hypothetical protein